MDGLSKASYFSIQPLDVVHTSTGRIARPSECEGKPGIGNIFVVVDKFKFLWRTVTVKKMHILTELPQLMTFA